MTDQSPKLLTIFLDFDGVLHPEPGYEKDLFNRMPIFEQVVRKHLDSVEVVISSSWREKYSLDDMRNYFSRDTFLNVIDVTPQLKSPTSLWQPTTSTRFIRQAEIQMWLKEHRSWDQPWLAIDDRPYWFEPACPHLLLTDRTTGLTDDDAITLNKMIVFRI